MDEMEKLIWATAFCSEFNNKRNFYAKNAYICKDRVITVDDIDGFSCSEIADIAVVKFREAVNSEDKCYLLPFKENWFDG